MLTQEKKAILDKLYHEDKVYCGRDKLWKYASMKFPEAMISRRDTMAFLYQDPIWQKTAPPPPRKVTKQIAFDRPGAFQTDLTGPLHRTPGGYEFILGLVEANTRRMYVKPLRNKEASTVAAALKEIVEENNLEPKICFSDNGLEFKAEFSEYLVLIGSKQWFNQAHSPWQNSLIERRWSILKKMLFKNELDTGSKDWVKPLQTLVDVINNTQCRTLKTTPELAADLPDGIRIERLKSGGIMKKHMSTKSALKVGEFVRLRLRKKKGFKALKQTYSDQIYLVTKVIHSTDSKIVTYKISEDGTKILSGTYNITDLLKVDNKPLDTSRLIEPDHVGERSINDQRLVDQLAEQTADVPEVRETRRPKPDASGEYEVQAILAARKFGKVKKYLIHWKGYSKSKEDTTWETAKDLSGAKELLAEFRKKERLRKK